MLPGYQLNRNTLSKIIENMPQIAGNRIYATVLFQNFPGGDAPDPPPSLGVQSAPKRTLHALPGVPTTYFIAIRQLL